MTPKLCSVIRLDSLPLNQTSFTNEGYLLDRPILTTTGIFEYLNPDGSVRRELRLPEDVFDPESLKSYKGRPIIITHDAGLVTKDNVRDNQIGTILTEGYRSGDDVRAEIIIHDTDGMKRAGLKELSLGYNLELDETPGEWNGQHYDAIQRNIRINHLALVREARAGEQARLNIDGREPDKALKGGKVMSKTKKPNAQRTDGTLTPEEFAKAIEQYQARRAQRIAEKQVDSEEKPVVEPVAEPVVKDEEEKVSEPVVDSVCKDGEETVEEQIQMVKDRRDRRDEEGDPADVEAAQGMIAQQDEDISILFDIIDTLLAEKDFQKADSDPAADPASAEPPVVVEDEDDKEPVIGVSVGNADEETDPVPATNAAEEEKPTMNADSMDAIIRERIQLGILGRKLNLDGLEYMKANDARKAIVQAVRPGLRLDGKSAAYVKAAFDLAVEDMEAHTVKDTNYQKRQMFNGDGRSTVENSSSSEVHRQRMIERQMNKNKEDK